MNKGGLFLSPDAVATFVEVVNIRKFVTRTRNAPLLAFMAVFRVSKNRWDMSSSYRLLQAWLRNWKHI